MRFGRVAVLLSVFLAVTVTLAQAQTQPGAMTSSETVSGSERFVPRWEISLGGGVTDVYLHWKMTGTLSEKTIGHETGEDFYAQELPIPLLSLRGEYPIAPRWRLLGTVDGGLLPKVDSLRKEGGTVKLAQAHADVFAGVRYEVTPRLFADGGYSYT